MTVSERSGPGERTGATAADSPPTGTEPDVAAPEVPDVPVETRPLVGPVGPAALPPPAVLPVDAPAPRPVLPTDALPPEAFAGSDGVPAVPPEAHHGGNRGFSAFRTGFVGAVGVLVAIGLFQAIAEVGQIVTLVFGALFLALGLDPLVTWLERHGVPRPLAVSITFVGLVGAVVGFVAAIAPVVIEEATQLIRVTPFYARRIEQSDLAQRLDSQFGLFARINAEIEARLNSQDTIDAFFGGVLGAGRAVVTGVFSVLLVLVLTLYFLASLRSMTEGAYRLVPRSRRAWIRSIADEAQARIGGYVLGQVCVATLNGALSFVLMSILDVRYSVALAVAVGVFGLIPLIGATIGAVLVCTIAFLGEPTDGIVLAIWFVIYQQVENYVILPRIMARTVAVPSTLAVVAALIGGSLLGLIGALVAIPIAATVLLVVQRVVYPRQEQG